MARTITLSPAEYQTYLRAFHHPQISRDERQILAEICTEWPKHRTIRYATHIHAELILMRLAEREQTAARSTIAANLPPSPHTPPVAPLTTLYATLYLDPDNDTERPRTQVVTLVALPADVQIAIPCVDLAACLVLLTALRANGVTVAERDIDAVTRYIQEVPPRPLGQD